MSKVKIEENIKGKLVKYFSPALRGDNEYYSKKGNYSIKIIYTGNLIEITSYQIVYGKWITSQNILQSKVFLYEDEEEIIKEINNLNERIKLKEMFKKKHL